MDTTDELLALVRGERNVAFARAGGMVQEGVMKGGRLERDDGAGC